MNFEWNAEKNKSNIAKHGISFDEAETVFEDRLYIDFYDPDHSENEDRYIILGLSNKERLLIVSYTERSNGIRLISAREATKNERKFYEK